MQRTLVALWFADIARYSTYAAEDESGALRLVEILQALSREIVPRHKGRVVKFVGDAVLAEFPSTELAVRAAAALSHEFREQSATGGEAHDLRVGVHLADVAVAPDGDLYGDGVNAAARIQETAEPGQVAVSEDVWRQLRGRREFQFQDLGERSLKGTGSIDLYAVNVQVDQARSLGSNLTKDVHLAEGKKSTIRSVAVLPLADLSAERDQEYFGDGVAEEILNALAKIGGLHVPARTSCFAFRGATVDAREIGRRLGVEALLEGSIRKAGDRLRITVQLIDARNGFQLWSERFDRELNDIFAVQDEIARSVIDALGLSLAQREKRTFIKRSTTNVEAYEFYLRGRKRFQEWTRQEAAMAFERAIDLDPTFFDAYYYYARSCFKSGDFEKALRLFKKAESVRPEDYQSPYLAALALTKLDRCDEARRAEERALERVTRHIDLNPDDARACVLLAGVLAKAGETERARPWIARAMSLASDDDAILYNAGCALAILGEDEQALDALEKAIGAGLAGGDWVPHDPDWQLLRELNRSTSQGCLARVENYSGVCVKRRT